MNKKIICITQHFASALADKALYLHFQHHKTGIFIVCYTTVRTQYSHPKHHHCYLWFDEDDLWCRLCNVVCGPRQLTVQRTVQLGAGLYCVVVTGLHSTTPFIYLCHLKLLPPSPQLWLGTLYHVNSYLVRYTLHVDVTFREKKNPFHPLSTRNQRAKSVCPCGLETEVSIGSFVL